AASGTGGAATARLGALALAMLAGFEARRLDFGGHPEDGIFEIDLQVVTQVFAPLRSVAPPSAASAKQVAQAEKLAEDVAEVGELIRIDAAGALHGLVPESIVGGALLRIAEHAVSLGRLLESLFSFLVIRIAIRVMVHGQPAIGGLQGLVVCVPANAEHFVIVSL